jgi:sugar phosphate isomerase/epimerase
VELGLWWGTVEGASLVDLIEAAGTAGFAQISVSPVLYDDARTAGHGDTELRQRLADAGVRVSTIDPMIAGLPGSRTPESVSKRFRATFEYDRAACFAAAAALEAPALNIAHYLGDPTPIPQLTDAIGTIARQGAAEGVAVLIEAIPEGGIPDLATAVQIVEGIDEPFVQLMFDTWHWWRTGASIDVVAGLAPGRIRTVQTSDAPAATRGTGVQPPSPDRLQPGEGVIPLVELLRLCLANNPAVEIGPEVFDRARMDEPAIERAQRSFEALRPVVAQAIATLAG